MADGRSLPYSALRQQIQGLGEPSGERPSHHQCLKAMLVLNEEVSSIPLPSQTDDPTGANWATQCLRSQCCLNKHGAIDTGFQHEQHYSPEAPGVFLQLVTPKATQSKAAAATRCSTPSPATETCTTVSSATTQCWIVVMGQLTAYDQITNYSIVRAVDLADSPPSANKDFEQRLTATGCSVNRLSGEPSPASSLRSLPTTPPQGIFPR